MLALKFQLFGVVQSPSPGTVVCLCALFHSSLFKNALEEYPVTLGGFTGLLWNSSHGKTARNAMFYSGGGSFQSSSMVPA